MSPEYAIDGLFSVKSDVFSFGVLVLEMVSGKRNRGFTHSDHKLNLLGHVSGNMMSFFFSLTSFLLLSLIRCMVLKFLRLGDSLMKKGL